MIITIGVIIICVNIIDIVLVILCSITLTYSLHLTSLNLHYSSSKYKKQQLVELINTMLRINTIFHNIHTAVSKNPTGRKQVFELHKPIQIPILASTWTSNHG